MVNKFGAFGRMLTINREIEALTGKIQKNESDLAAARADLANRDRITIQNARQLIAVGRLAGFHGVLLVKRSVQIGGYLEHHPNMVVEEIDPGGSYVVIRPFPNVEP